MTLSDAEAATLRLLVADTDREVEALPAVALRAAWTRLVGALALGSAPEMRACPVCGRDGRRAATVCGYCWTKLTPLPALTGGDPRPAAGRLTPFATATG